MLHVWLLPALFVLLLVVFGFYLLVRNQGNRGVRTDGKTVVDKPDDD